jgi:nitrite reductase/ring-hydroxylating ferredoxin subunit
MRLPRLGPGGIGRRTLLWGLLGLLGQAHRRRGQALSLPLGGLAPAYRGLETTVSLPLEEVAELWRPVAFDAWFTLPSAPGEAPAERLLKGLLLRVSPSSSGESGLRAYCQLCPHETCYVEFTSDTRTVRVESQEKPDHPLMVCPCHFSVFDPARDGACIEGPSTRGLYRFRIEARGRRIEILEVEEAALAIGSGP